MKQVHLHIVGRVQGVFFRNSAKGEALQLGLVGWVRNNADGSVETEACGDDAAVDAYIAWCRKGPDRAEVTEIRELPLSQACPSESFEIVV